MNAIDIKNAFSGSSDCNNFTVLLLRLIAKSDGDNRAKLAVSYPAEVEAVKIFQTACPYADDAHSDPDWDTINEWAHMATANKPGATGDYPDGQKAAEDDEGGLKMAIFVDEARNLLGIDFGKSVKWIAFGKNEAKMLGLVLAEKANLLKD